MSGFPKPREPRQAHSLIATPPTAPNSAGSPSFGKCFLMILVLLLALGAVAFLGNMKIDRVLKQSAANGQKAADAKTAADAAQSSAAATAGLLQSIGQALNTGVANGTLTPQQLQAIAAAIAANQAAKGAAKAQAGTTPGIPGSRSGGGLSWSRSPEGSATMGSMLSR